jgi:hypothetical protein
VTGASREWLPGAESENDWNCPECAANSDLTEHSTKLLCVHCIKALRERFDAKVGKE